MRMVFGSRWRLLACVAAASLAAGPSAQSMEDLLRRIDALQRRVDELEASRPATPRQAAAPLRAPRATQPRAAPAPRPTAPSGLAGVPLAAPQQAPPTPEEQRAITRAQVDEALRGSMPNSWRIPARTLGAALRLRQGEPARRHRHGEPQRRAVRAERPPDRQRRHAAIRRHAVQRAPLAHRLRHPDPDGLGASCVSKLEFDFAGDLPSASGAATSSGYMPRLRQAYVEVGGEVFRVLVGQANSVWNDGLVETLTNATFLNASAVRQAQIRITGRLAPGADWHGLAGGALHRLHEQRRRLLSRQLLTAGRAPRPRPSPTWSGG